MNFPILNKFISLEQLKVFIKMAMVVLNLKNVMAYFDKFYENIKKNGLMGFFSNF